ncbi:MAG: deoxyguanosinetriphosphate triphosphohydrolase [Gemmataceae bacterium]|nr:deoxyguanosinetriphosphate triphosphohydrolase [Gemmataceae bacterium]MCI0737617.1 deoxyguanosinetriphosphate triphosphohydrolase [Gemmataceae bacterium]
MPYESSFAGCNYLEREDALLAPYAMRTRHSKGRRYPEAEHPYRTLYPRDRDRIVHSTAFRRLMHKTQVLVGQPGDHHRTRLTHTLEVTQISRTIARQLGLNEDLTEAIALMHDLGHPPFGHAGEAALDECMRGHGGFEHNCHGLRIVEELEYRYAEFPGLNLSYEVLEAQALHSKRRDAPEVARFVNAGQPLLEAQVVDAADSLAYDSHDIDDALSLGVITLDDLSQVPFWLRAVERARSQHARLPALQFQATVVRALIDWQVTDLLEQTSRCLEQEKIRALEDVRRAARILVTPSNSVQTQKEELEKFLHERVYRHPRITRMAHKGQRMLRLLFDELCAHPEKLPQRYQERARASSLKRTVCDYLAGMTDRFAQDEYLRLFQPNTPL